MGVTELWSILSPVQETVPLYSLAGKSLAVDLSLWICEAQHVQAMIGKVTKPHLRNLFFRASSLLRMGVKLVFVMEGEAPKIKAETMSKRTEMAFRGKARSTSKPAMAKNTGRGRFKAILRECAEMLNCLGIPWVSAAGEAEAMCAFLDAQGVVDGCITSDGDAFLYGARTVYRNFNMNTKDPQIDCYKMSRVEKELKLTQETLVGVAVLLGCDYIPKGVAGVGKEQTLKLIQNLKGQSLLQKFTEWKKEGSDILNVAVKKLTHCLVCRHPGSAKIHECNGCIFCDSKQFCQPQDYDSQCPCDWHQTEHARQASSVETSVKKKTLACDKFPFTEIINEFLVPKDKAMHSFKRRKPNLLLMQNFALEKMEWPKYYTSEKVLVLMTYTELVNRRHGTETPAQIEPLRICKRRIRNGISCFEVMWKKPDDYTFPEDCTLEEPDIVRTVEEENLFTVAYPHIVQLFHKETSETKDHKLKKKKAKTEKDNPTTSRDTVSDLLSQMSLQSSQSLKSPVSLETVLVNSTALQSTTSQSLAATLDAPKLLKQLLHEQDVQTTSDTSVPSLIHQPEIPPSPCPTGTFATAHSSPSVSAMLEELHLSSIDWDALSFTAAPSPQHQSCEADLRQLDKYDESDKAAKTCLDSSTALGSGCGEPTVLHASDLSERPLRERVIMRCVIKTVNFGDNKEHATEAKVNANSELKGTDSSNVSKLSCKPLSENNDVPPHAWGQKPGFNGLNHDAPASKKKTVTKKIQMSKECLPVQAQDKYTLVKSKPSSVSSLLPQRSYSDPSYQRTSSKSEQTSQQNVCKRSVCIRQGSSSGDSDGESQARKDKDKHKLKAKAKSKSHNCQKTVWCVQLAEHDRNGTIPMKEQLSSGLAKKSPDSTANYRQATAHVSSNLTPHIAMCSVKSDDDFDLAESPLPLADRLKLKLIK